MSKYNRQEQLKEIHKERRKQTDKKAFDAIDELLRLNEPVNFKRVSVISGISISTLYSHKEVRIKIEKLRLQLKVLPSPADLKASVNDQGKDAMIASLKRKIEKLEAENRKLHTQLNNMLNDSLAHEFEKL